MVVLGIDPGIARMGFGVIDVFPENSITKRAKFINCGVVETDKNTDYTKRLLMIEKELKKIIKEYNPEAAVIEKIFFAKNQKTIINVSQATGVIKLTIGRKKIPITEFTPLQVKMAMTGYGHAKKDQIQKAIVKFLNLKETPKTDDAADALALALSFAWQL